MVAIIMLMMGLACILSFLYGCYTSQKYETRLAEKGLITILNGIAYKYVKITDYADYLNFKNAHTKTEEEKEVSKEKIDEKI